MPGLYPVSPHAKFRLLTEMPNLGSTPFAQGTAVQLYKTLQLRATARDRGAGLPVAIAGTGSSAIIMRDMSLW